MSLSKRLHEAAGQRSSRPAPLKTLEVGRGRTGPQVVDLETTAPEPRLDIDLRPASIPPSVVSSAPSEDPSPVRGDQAKRPGPLSRFAARSQRVERREAKLAKAAEAAHGHAVDVRTDAPVCPRCAGPARIDINDRTRGVLHLSCDSCFKMWQVREADAREHDGRSLSV